jgi:hypothetical protein
MITEMETAEKAEDAEKSLNAEARRRKDAQRYAGREDIFHGHVSCGMSSRPAYSLRFSAPLRLCVQALLCALNTLGAPDPEPVR